MANGDRIYSHVIENNINITVPTEGIKDAIINMVKDMTRWGLDELNKMESQE